MNDLERVVVPRRPEIARLKACLLKAGAETALMSGSGSAVFGTFAERSGARLAAARLPRGLRVFVTKPLTALPTVRSRTGRSPSW